MIMGDERDPRQHGDDVIADEWTSGPYYRDISLPMRVDGSLTNATYGNGVLLRSMPKSINWKKRCVLNGSFN
jgi:HSP20 family molecular chaperone IbpA